MGTDNTQFRRRFRVWRRKASERSSTFSLRFTAIGGSVSVGSRLKVGVLVEGSAWTPKSRTFVEDSSGSSGRPWVSGIQDSKNQEFPTSWSEDETFWSLEDPRPTAFPNFRSNLRRKFLISVFTHCPRRVL